MNDWKIIRKFYKEYQNDILEAGPIQYGVDPYWWEGVIEMTPIERSSWADIKSWGLAFYPQYPVLKYFVDFANPSLKIIIECDGKHWHDPAKDAVRDAELNKAGWTVYRFTGRECNKIGMEVEDEFGRTMYIKNDVESLMSEIKKTIVSTNCRGRIAQANCYIEQIKEDLHRRQRVFGGV